MFDAITEPRPTMMSAPPRPWIASMVSSKTIYDRTTATNTWNGQNAETTEVVQFLFANVICVASDGIRVDPPAQAHTAPIANHSLLAAAEERLAGDAVSQPRPGGPHSG